MIFRIQNRLQYTIYWSNTNFFVLIYRVSGFKIVSAKVYIYFENFQFYHPSQSNNNTLHNPVNCTLHCLRDIPAVHCHTCVPSVPESLPALSIAKIFSSSRPWPGWCWQCWHIWDARALSLGSQGQATYTGKYDSVNQYIIDSILDRECDHDDIIVNFW